MGFLTRLLNPTNTRAAVPATGWRSLLSAATASGITITPESALQIGAVYACVRVLAESLAQLPLHLRRHTSNGDNQLATSHPLYNILRWQPNAEWTAFQYLEQLMVGLALRGNFFAEIVWHKNGHIAELWPIHPDRVLIERGTDNQLYYHVTTGYAGTAERRRDSITLPFWKIHHIRLMSTDGIHGLSPIALARQGIGLAAAAETFGAAFFGNGATPGGVLEYPGVLDDSAYDRLITGWNRRHKGANQAGSIAILEEGMTYRPITINPDDAQYLETRKMQAIDIARIFRVPAHLINELDRATFTNIEHQSLEFVTFSLQPYMVRIEQAIARDLLLTSERPALYADFDAEALLRGDIQARYNAYALGRQWGWLSGNDVRKRENMPIFDGGDIYMMPLNMAPVDQLVSSSQQTNQTKRDHSDLPNSAENRTTRAANTRHRLYTRGNTLLTDALGRILRREANDITNAYNRIQKRNTERDHLDRPSSAENRAPINTEFNTWLDDFYIEHHNFITRQLTPVATAYTQLVSDAVSDEIGQHDQTLDNWLRAYLAAYANRHIGKSRADLNRALSQPQPDQPDPIDQLADQWRNERPDTTARDESVRLNNAIAVTIYAAVGIRSIRWLSFGESCPYCTALNGRTIGIEEYFIPAGTEFTPDGITIALKPSTNIRHAPAHRGCDCLATAA